MLFYIVPIYGKGRPQHTPSQTDAFARFVQEHVAVFYIYIIGNEMA